MLVAVPQNAKVSARVLTDNVSRQDLQFPILPAPTLRVREDGNVLPQEDGMAVVPNASVYASAELYPAETVSVSVPAFWRSQRYVRVQLRPYQYNPARQRMVRHNKLVVEINFGLDRTMSAVELGITVPEGDFERIFKQSFVNYETARAWRAMQRSSTAAPHAESATGQGDAYKIPVTKDGIYKVTCAALQSAGLIWNSFTFNTLQLKLRGNEIAIQVKDDGDNVCENGESFLFFGQAPDDPLTEANIYWLTFGGADGRRMSQRAVTGAQTADVYTKTLHL